MPVRKEGTEGYSMGDQGGDLPLLVLKMIMDSCRFQGIERVLGSDSLEAYRACQSRDRPCQSLCKAPKHI